MRIFKTTCCILLPAFFCFCKIQAQPDINRVTALLKKKRPIQAIYNLYSTKNNFSTATHIKRTIDGGHKQLIAETDGYPDKYEILVQEDDKGAYLSIVNKITYKKNERITTTILFKADTERLQKFIVIHDSRYNSHLAIDSFKTFSINRYGAACSSSGEPTPAFEAMMNLVSMKDTTSLVNWMQRFDYEIKVLGATGLLILEQKGISINSDHCFLTDHLAKLQLPINSCLGCTFWDSIPSEQLLNEQWIAYIKQ